MKNQKTSPSRRQPKPKKAGSTTALRCKNKNRASSSRRRRTSATTKTSKLPRTCCTEDEGDLDEIDVFEPAEEDFDSSVQSGESHAELAPVMAMRSPVAVETPWDGLTFGILAVSSVCLLLAGVMMYDLVRTEWYFDQNVVVGTSLIDWVRGLFPTT